MRKPIIAGNWKMNHTAATAKAMVSELIPLVKDAKADVVLCTPFTCLYAVSEAVKGTNIKLGAENMHFAEKGAYTGEISAEMLKELGVEFVIIGHSERREYFAETNETVNKKVKAALAAGLTPIVCCGETLEQREAGITGEWVSGQIKEALAGLTAEQVSSLVIAYEPIWAIGTGRTATAADANDVIGLIRSTVREMFGCTAAAAIRIQYGGSMNPKNVKELMAQPEIDGGLIGGASLKAADFSLVVNY